ncbi:hypothetical protein L211DRAFT_875649, partial [Terfezia boudieri ATCC MYA-4762]
FKTGHLQPLCQHPRQSAVLSHSRQYCTKASFDHSTCALSVSCQYLALDGIYHPFRAAFPNNSTH